MTAWKLAYVLRGWADPSLLQTYGTERRAYALDLIYFDREISQSLEGAPAAEYQRLVSKLSFNDTLNLQDTRRLHKQNMFTRYALFYFATPSYYPDIGLAEWESAMRRHH